MPALLDQVIACGRLLQLVRKLVVCTFVFMHMHVER
jgi:hypothetical protein